MTNEHRRILVVDDEPQITRVLRTTLSAQGYDIRVANDGEMALELMKNWTPHVVVTDLAMPNLDGVELCRQVRKLSQVPIIVLSVRGQDHSKVEALDAGADQGPTPADAGSRGTALHNYRRRFFHRSGSAFGEGGGA